MCIVISKYKHKRAYNHFSTKKALIKQLFY